MMDKASLYLGGQVYNGGGGAYCFHSHMHTIQKVSPAEQRRDSGGTNPSPY